MYITIKSLWERHKNKSLIAKMTGHNWKTVAKKIKRSRSYSLSYFLSCFYGDKTNPPFVDCYTFYIRIKIYKRGWFSLLAYFLSVRLLSVLHDKNKFKFLFSLNFNYFLSVMRLFSLFYLLYCFCKRGVISPCLQKQYSFSLPGNTLTR